MAQVEHGSRGAANPNKTCTSVKDLLDQVTDELNKFEAKKLGELKAELEAFFKKQKALVADYEKQFPQLRDKWCVQQQSVQKLHAAIMCAFPAEELKKIVAECICDKKYEVKCLEDRIARRKRCCQGPLERARDLAKARFEQAKAELDALATNAQKIAAVQADNDKLIKEIQGLLGTPDQGVVLLLGLFKLFPAQKALTPDTGIDDSCKTFGDGETPEKLCADTYGKPCRDQTPDPCKPAEDDETAAEPDKTRKAPWLISPADYERALNCAWEVYRKAKDDYAIAESAYKAKPDDLVSLGKQLDEQNKALDEQIRICLKDAGPEDTCCKPQDSTDKKAYAE